MSPRPQPYGLSTGRGQFERNLRGGRSAPRPGVTAPPIEFVGATKASVPASGTGGFETYVTIPIHTNVQDGDLMVGALAFSGPDSWGYTTPGWFQTDYGDMVIIARIASSEPASYTFSGVSFSAGVARSGVLNAFRNVSAVGDLAQAAGVTTVADLNNVKNGSALCAFAKGRTTLTTEPWAADSPMTLGQKHNGACLLPYCTNTTMASAYELDLGVGLITGRGFSWTGPGSPAQPETYGAILEPL